MQSAQAYPSIQSFYEREVPKSTAKDLAATSAAIPGDGFTKYELSDALDPLNRKWKPEQDYQELGIGDLVPGPKAVNFIGRVVNASTVYGRSQKQPKAGGWHYLILKDNTAAISVHITLTRFRSLRLTSPDQSIFYLQGVSFNSGPCSFRLDGFHIRCIQIWDQANPICLFTRQLIPRSCHFRPHHHP